MVATLSQFTNHTQYTIGIIGVVGWACVCVCVDRNGKVSSSSTCAHVLRAYMMHEMHISFISFMQWLTCVVAKDADATRLLRLHHAENMSVNFIIIIMILFSNPFQDSVQLKIENCMFVTIMHLDKRLVFVWLVAITVRLINSNCSSPFNHIRNLRSITFFKSN